VAATAGGLSRLQALRWPAALILPAIVVYLLPDVGQLLLYDRAAILEGEFWRLFTGHWVHFSADHLLFDTAALGITAWLSALRGDRLFPAFCLLAAPAISLALFFLLPEMARYGGLSGISMGGTIYLGLQGWRERGPWRRVCLTVLVLGLVKLGVDLSLDRFVMIAGADPAVIPVPQSHLVGAVCAVVAWICTGRRKRDSPLFEKRINV
jgi:rhomboid family GlyGly-CTERM serine protease